MKIMSAILLLSMTFSTYASNTSKVMCRSLPSNTKDDSELSFELNKNGNKSVATNIIGHVFVKSFYDETATFNTDNAYMGFFKTDKLAANPNYNPRKYVGYAQFENLNAVHTTGLESGMFGYLAIDVAGIKSEFMAVYVFQAGDHMGGTIFLNCKGL